MLTRQIIAGPSRSIILRQFTSASISDVAGARGIPLRSQITAVTPIRDRASARSGQKSQSRVQHLLELASNESRDHSHISQKLWRIYRNLTPAERAGISSEQLKVILRLIVPSFDNAHATLNRPSPRQRLRDNRTISGQWEIQLRAVMSDLVARSGADLLDWLFVLRSLALGGHVSATETVAREIPERYRHNINIIEYRLRAITRWVCNIESTARRPTISDVNLALDAFWAVFREIQDANADFRNSTLDLLLSATGRFSRLVILLEHEPSTARYDELFRLLLLDGYHLDLGNLASSLSSCPTHIIPNAPTISHHALNAILSYLNTRGASPFRLLSVFDLIAFKPSISGPPIPAPAINSIADESEMGPTLSGLTAAEERSSERRDWLGRRLNKGRDPSFFVSTIHSTPKTVSQDRRTTESFTSLHMPISDAFSPTSVHATEPTYDSETIRIVLKAACDSGDWHFAIQVLEGGLITAKKTRAQWLSAYRFYLRKELPPLRPLAVHISPEWFRIVLALSNRSYGRGANRIAHATEGAMAWMEAEIATLKMIEVEQTEAMLKATTSSRPALKTIDPLPEGLSTTGLGRYRSFNASKAIDSLLKQHAHLSQIASRAHSLASRRSKWLKNSRERRVLFLEDEAVKAARAARIEMKMTENEDRKKEDHYHESGLRLAK